MSLFGKGSAPPPPDYSGIAAANEKSAQYAFELGKQQLEWAKQQYASDREITDKIVTNAIDISNKNLQTAADDRARYEQRYQPLEDELIQKARTYNTPQAQERSAAKAGAMVAQQFEGARGAAQRQLESFGIDPSSTRGQALDIGTRTAQAAATAAAGNQAIQQTQDRADNYTTAALNIGKGYPAQIAQQYGTSTGAGNSAVNSTLAATQSGANTMGTPAQWQGQGNSALGNWGQALNMGYNNQLDAYKANQSSSSGIGSLLGLAGGLMRFEDGGAVPIESSPSGGAAIDDVPVQAPTGPARLNAGEFVVPEDVTRWKGEEFFQKLIMQSRQQKTTAPAAPKTSAIPMQRAASAQSAIPVG